MKGWGIERKISYRCPCCGETAAELWRDERISARHRNIVCMHCGAVLRTPIICVLANYTMWLCIFAALYESLLFQSLNRPLLFIIIIPVGVISYLISIYFPMKQIDLQKKRGKLFYFINTKRFSCPHCGAVQESIHGKMDFYGNWKERPEDEEGYFSVFRGIDGYQWKHRFHCRNCGKAYRYSRLGLSLKYIRIIAVAEIALRLHTRSVWVLLGLLVITQPIQDALFLWLPFRKTEDEEE